MRRVAVLLLPMLLLAGCVSLPDDVGTASLPDAEAAAAVVANLQTLLAGVPCEAKTVGAGTSENLLPVATLPYDESTHGEIDIRGDWMLVARYASGGFELVNVADPAKPRLVAVYQSEEKSAYDVKWMPDGRTAVVGHGRTIDLVDVSPVMDPALTAEAIDMQGLAPVLLDSWKYPGGGRIPFTNMHMLTSARIGDIDFVFIAPNDDAGIMVTKLVGEGAERKLETIGRIGADVLGGGPLGPHDMSLVVDEITQKPLLYVANGFEGWRVFDVSDPAKPIGLATMPNLLTGQGYTHTVIGQKVGDRRILAAIQEVGVNTLSIFDVTNFATPILLAQWQADRREPTNPQHNIQLLNGTLYMAHYTKGVYVFDLNKLDKTPVAGTLSLRPVAHYAPEKPGQAGPTGFDNIWDVVVHRGLLYVNDVKAGTHVIGYGCLVPGDETATSVN